MRIPTFVFAAAASVALSAVAVPAHAFDLTGHWVGKWTCKGFDGNKFTDENKQSTLAITQSINSINALIDQDIHFSGAAIPDAKKPDTKGETVFIDCDTNIVLQASDGNSEIIRASVKTDTKPGSSKASFKGLSILENAPPAFGEEVQTCKYSYKRVDTMDPPVGPCP